MLKLTILVGPPGSGKSTLALKEVEKTEAIYVNQDSQGEKHLEIFYNAVADRKNIVIDRMNFNKQQRAKYIASAKLAGYYVMVLILCQPQAVCLDRMLKRENHETIKNEKSARAALQTFFTKYEPPEYEENIDNIIRIFPEGPKTIAIYSDLDGTLCDVEHRRHFVRDIPEGQRKNWKAFMAGIPKDKVNQPVLDILQRFVKDYPIIFCTGRNENHKKETVEWLTEHVDFDYSLYMRHRNDSRADYLVKEILLDFEILTRYSIYFCLDDRDQVVDMLRRRGMTVLQVAEGDF